MDESLKLLLAVETLDLSYRFLKVDNLKKCVKLEHLDLGSNQLRSITMLSEVSSGITNMNFRNNALSILKGLENMKSLHQLDLSSNNNNNMMDESALSRQNRLVLRRRTF